MLNKMYAVQVPNLVNNSADMNISYHEVSNAWYNTQTMASITQIDPSNGETKEKMVIFSDCEISIVEHVGSVLQTESYKETVIEGSKDLLLNKKIIRSSCSNEHYVYCIDSTNGVLKCWNYWNPSQWEKDIASNPAFKRADFLLHLQEKTSANYSVSVWFVFVGLDIFIFKNERLTKVTMTTNEFTQVKFADYFRKHLVNSFDGCYSLLIITNDGAVRIATITTGILTETVVLSQVHVNDPTIASKSLLQSCQKFARK